MSEQEIILTKDQEEIIISSYDKIDIGSITRTVFKDEKLKGTTREGRAIIKFLTDNQLSFTTSAKEKKEEIILTEEQKQFVMSNIKIMTTYEMAKSIWQDKTITNLSKEFRTIAEYRKTIDVSQLSSEDKALTEEYVEPKSIAGCIIRLKKYKLADLAESKINQEQKESLESLWRCFTNYRFLQTIRNYLKIEDREFFEFQYMSYVWGKDEMAESDIQTCITIASDYVTLRQAQRQKISLDYIIDDVLERKAAGEDKKRIEDGMTKLSEKLQELCESTQSRITSMTNGLEGKRTDRMKLKTEANKSILVLVEAIKKEEGRQAFIKHAALEKRAVEAKIEQIEKAQDMFAKLYGVSKSELLN